MLNFMIRNKIKKTFDKVPLKNKADVLKAVCEKAEPTKTFQVKKPHRILASVAISVLIIVILSVGIPMIKINPTTKKTEVVLSPSILSVKAFASSDSSEKNASTMKLDQAIHIQNDYNPILSSSAGIGIHFEFIYEGVNICLTAQDGCFVTWDAENGSGPVNQVGKTFQIQGKGEIFWCPDHAEAQKSNGQINVILKKGKQIVGLALIKIEEEPENHIFKATLKKSVQFDLVNGRNQKIGQDFIDRFFENKRNTQKTVRN